MLMPMLTQLLTCPLFPLLLLSSYINSSEVYHHSPLCLGDLYQDVTLFEAEWFGQREWCCPRCFVEARQKYLARLYAEEHERVWWGGSGAGHEDEEEWDYDRAHDRDRRWLGHRHTEHRPGEDIAETFVPEDAFAFRRCSSPHCLSNGLRDATKEARRVNVPER